MKALAAVLLFAAADPAWAELRMREHLLWRESVVKGEASFGVAEGFRRGQANPAELAARAAFFNWILPLSGGNEPMPAEFPNPSLSLQIAFDQEGKALCSVIFSTAKPLGEVLSIEVRDGDRTHVFSAEKIGTFEAANGLQFWTLDPFCPSGFSTGTLLTRKGRYETYFFVPEALWRARPADLDADLKDVSEGARLRLRQRTPASVPPFTARGLQITLLKTAGRQPLWSEFFTVAPATGVERNVPAADGAFEIWADAYFKSPPEYGGYFFGIRRRIPLYRF